MRIVIIGGGYAGMSCALRLAQKSHGKAEITLINGSERFVERIRLHEQASGKPASQRLLAEQLAGSGVRLRVGWVRHVDLAQRTLQVGPETLVYDKLVLALGSESDLEGAPGVREHAYGLDAASAAWLGAAIPALAKRSGRVVVVGGGLTGVETASELAESFPGLRVLLVTRGEILPEGTPRARAYVRATLARLGVALRERLSVHSLSQNELHSDGGIIPFDSCIWCVGFRAPRFARELGLSVNERGQVWVDGALRSLSHPDVYVAGDLAALHDESRGPALPMGCKSAFPTGFHVAENLSRSLRGEPAREFRYTPVPYCVSLGRRDAVIQLPGGGLSSGRFAACIKELICRGTMWALALERRRAAPLAILSARRPLLPGPTTERG